MAHLRRTLDGHLMHNAAGHLVYQDCCEDGCADNYTITADCVLYSGADCTGDIIRSCSGLNIVVSRGGWPSDCIGAWTGNTFCPPAPIVFTVYATLLVFGSTSYRVRLGSFASVNEISFECVGATCGIGSYSPLAGTCYNDPLGSGQSESFTNVSVA